MDGSREQSLNLLRQAGWDVQRASEDAELPRFYLDRYDWLPAVVSDFLLGVDSAVSPDQKAWFVTWREIAGSSDSAFAWNEWERQSLEGAEDDQDWQTQITSWWDEHCPLVLSVKSGYSHLSLRREDLAIVGGFEPEFEEVSVVTANWEQLFQQIAAGDSSLSVYF